jgi:hypothetical protein
MDTPQRLMLGRPLEADVLRLLTEVERMYGCEVSFEPWEEATIFEGGSCTVREDCTPVITINLNHPRLQDAVVHELRHLLLRKQGYPFFALKNDVGERLDLGNLRQLFFELYEPILHHVFNPAIRDMGRNPADLFDPMFRQNLEPGEMEQNESDIAWPLIYARILLECGDPDVKEQLREICERLGWEQAMDKARRITEEIRAMTEPTPQLFVDVVIKCANIAFAGIYRFSVIELTNVQKGHQIENKLRIRVSTP